MSAKTPPTGKPDPSTLSDRQRRILEVIRDAVVLRGYPPSIREIGDAAGLQSTSSVAYQLKQLEKKGFLRRDPNKPRAVDVRTLPSTEPARKPGRKVAAKPSAPTSAPEGAGAANFIPVLGRIAAGSPILAEQEVEDYYPLPADLVGDGEATAKEFHKDSTGVWLLPRNDDYAPIPGDQAEIMGKIVSVFRRL